MEDCGFHSQSLHQKPGGIYEEQKENIANGLSSPFAAVGPGRPRNYASQRTALFFGRLRAYTGRRPGTSAQRPVHLRQRTYLAGAVSSALCWNRSANTASWPILTRCASARLLACSSRRSWPKSSSRAGSDSYRSLGWRNEWNGVARGRSRTGDAAETVRWTVRLLSLLCSGLR